MRTQDRALSDVFTVENIGRTQELTPEGFLLCRDVPIARTGEMLYGDGEVPVAVGRDMIARITRGADVLMAPGTISSYEGKPVTLDHPEEEVNPDNWQRLAVGLVRNVRIGEGIDTDKLMADLLITDRTAINQVRDGLREVSCGYDADYEDDGDGRGRQVSITGNHVALVRRGRCGPVCSIGDSEMKTRDEAPKKTTLPAWARRALSAFRTGDEDSFVKELQGAPDVADMDGDPPDDKQVVINLNLGGEGGAAVDALAGAGAPVAGAGAPVPPAADGGLQAALQQALAPIMARLDALEGGGGAAEATAEDGDGDGVTAEEDADDTDPTVDSDKIDEGITEDDDLMEAERAASKIDEGTTQDSASLAVEFADTRARAEVLSPGIQLPTMDAAKPRRVTQDTMCLLRRRALARVADSHKKLVAPLTSGLDLKKATCDQVRTAFIGASELVRTTNDSRQFIPPRIVSDSAQKKGPPTIKDLNARAREVWAKK